MIHWPGRNALRGPIVEPIAPLTTCRLRQRAGNARRTGPAEGVPVWPRERSILGDLGDLGDAPSAVLR
jgi:hypothetical protein